jgi:YggT family protein
VRLLVCRFFQIYSLVIIARILLEWVQVTGDHPVARARRVLRIVTDPVLEPVRRLIPPLRAGGIGIDLSPLVVLVAISVIAGAVCG